MQTTSEGKIGIALGLFGLVGGGAIMIAPNQVWIGWVMIAVAAIGLILLAAHHFPVIRMKRAGSVIRNDWKTPVDAIEAFSNESVRNERDRRKQEAAKIRGDASKAELAIKKIYESYPAGGVSPPRAPPDILADYTTWREKLSAAVFSHDAATQTRGEADYQLLRQIVQQLAQGKLIAKGFRVPRDGLGETEIPQSEWRSLELDPITATASYRGTTIFTGVLIGKPEER